MEFASAKRTHWLSAGAGSVLPILLLSNPVPNVNHHPALSHPVGARSTARESKVDRTLVPDHGDAIGDAM